MELDHITSSLLHKTLGAWERSEELPTEILDLDLLGEQGAASLVERSHVLYEFISETVMATLARLRRDAGLVHAAEPLASKEELKSALRNDFSVGQANLEAWSALYHRYLTHTASMDVSELSEAANVGPRQFRRRLDAGLDHLTREVRTAERKVHQQRQVHYLGRYLPPPDYFKLFGVSALLEEVTNTLVAEDGPRFLSIEGLGGTGKTSLARAVAYRMAELGIVLAIPWISARQESLSPEGKIEAVKDPADSLNDVIARLVGQLGLIHLGGLATHQKIEELRPILSEKPYLIVIDNLETVTDLEALIPALQPLAGATRFLLTSRTTLRNYPHFQIIPVPDLSFEDSEELVRLEVKRRGKQHLLTEDIMKAIYETVGGLPLALKLLSTQLGILPLDEILMGLRRAREHAPESMFRYIYLRSWRLLDDLTRHLLLSMLLISQEGEDINWLQLISGLPQVELTRALAQLQQYSLVEITGTLEAPLYGLHRLTVTFLHSDVLQAPGW